jgi:signal transduction histidine kinase
MKILTVDDNVENLYLLEAMLRGAGCGYKVVCAHNGVEALQKLEKEKCDLIVSDILMPQMDGFELCRQVKRGEDSRHIPFIFYTATYTENKDVEFGMRLGASRFIIKPAEPEEFLSILRGVIQDSDTSFLVAAPPPAEDDEVLLKAYNRSLVHKLDQKVQQLEQLKQKLQQALEEKEAELTARRKAEEQIRLARDDLVRANTELERKVAQRTAQLAEANAGLQAFAYTAAHDLRSPLRAINSFSALAVEAYGEKLGAEGRSLLERVLDSVEQMQQLLTDLLEYSTISQADLKLEPVDLRKAVNEALALLDADVQAENAVVTVVDPLPKVFAHPATVVLLIHNLASNALKFIPSGVQPQIRIRAESVPGPKPKSQSQEKAEHAPRNTQHDSEPSTSDSSFGMARLWVEDNGIGIAPEDLERIFGPFERLHSKQAYPGTGLGLTIVRKGAERMGGRTGVESELGKGSRFWVELRMAPPGSKGEPSIPALSALL